MSVIRGSRALTAGMRGLILLWCVPARWSRRPPRGCEEAATMSGISISGDGLEPMSSVHELNDDPYPVYARLRSISPVQRGPAGEWMLLGYDEVAAALHDHRRFSSRVIDTEFFQERLRDSGMDPGDLIFTH